MARSPSRKAGKSGDSIEDFKESAEAVDAQSPSPRKNKEPTAQSYGSGSDMRDSSSKIGSSLKKNGYFSPIAEESLETYRLDQSSEGYPGSTMMLQHNQELDVKLDAIVIEVKQSCETGTEYINEALQNIVEQLMVLQTDQQKALSQIGGYSNQNDGGRSEKSKLDSLVEQLRSIHRQMEVNQSNIRDIKAHVGEEEEIKYLKDEVEFLRTNLKEFKAHST